MDADSTSGPENRKVVNQSIGEPTPSWRSIFWQYSQDTSAHGVAYVTQETRYPLRRVVWFCAVSTALSMFLWLIIERLVLYYDYPKTVNVEVTYETSLPFPAVTICNQNLFRLSRVQHLGIYDKVIENIDFTGGRNTGTLDPFAVISYGCVADNYEPTATYDLYVEMTLSGCKYLCQYLHGPTCALVVYMPLRRSCFLMENQDLPVLHGSEGCTFVEVYERGLNSGLDDNAGDAVIDNATVSVTGNMTDFYLHVGHQEEDFIYNCMWDGAPCRNNSWEVVLTDVGLCHTFNGDVLHAEHTNKTGAGFGLSLVINIEQYEYISGPNIDAGIKVYLHEQDDIPQIKNLGFAVSPGIHSLVAGKYSKHSSMGPPHGTCGEADLYMYDPGAKYTYSRCTEQCATEYTRQHCACVDAFMPGDDLICNLTQYLNCLVSIEYVEGFRFSDCECPDACNVWSYGAELSYAALSTLNVGGLLGPDTDDLSRKYHTALEINQRVFVENLQLTAENMHTLSQNLMTFDELTSNYSKLATERLNTISRRYTEIARGDIQYLLALLSQYEEGYINSYGSVMDPFIFFTQYIHHIVVFLRTRVNLRKINEYTGMEGLNNAQAVIQVMIKYLENMMHLDKAVTVVEAWAPVRFWPSVERQDQCNASYQMTLDDYEELNEAIDKAYIYFWDMLQDWSSDSVTSWPSRMDRACNSILTNNATLFNCSVEYRSILSTAHRELEAVLVEIEESLAMDFNFTYDDVLRNVQDDLQEIEGNLTWISSSLQDYIRNKTTKLDLSAQITTDTRDAVIQSLDTIFSKMDAVALALLRRNVDDIEFNIKHWYTVGLASLSHLSPFIDSDVLDDRCRGLAIWRSPSMDFSASDLIQFQHAADDFNDTWPTHITLSEFVDSDRAADLLTAITSTYADSMYGEMFKITLAFEDAKDSILSSFMDVITDLESFRTESMIGNQFILANFLKMDVYFAALKYDSVEQVEGYGILNFLSEVGGFMGLLVGASVLTLCELLDLIIYNMLRKCRDARRRKRVTSIINVREASASDTVTDVISIKPEV